MGKKGKVSTLHIDPSWGVDFHAELEAKIKGLLSVKSVTWQ